MFENRVLRRKYGHLREDVTEGLRKLHKKELQDSVLARLYIYIYTPRRRWKDNIKMDLQEVGRGCGDWMELAKDRDRWRALVSTLMNFRVP